jgi:starvation-inducible DNA-binding protein
MKSFNPEDCSLPPPGVSGVRVASREPVIHRQSISGVTAMTVAKQRDTAGIARQISAENQPESPVVQALRKQVANALVLYLNYKHYHWQTYGPLFRDLHKLFDRFAGDVLESLDPLAERVRMIGQNPPAHPIESMDLASVSAAAPHSTMREMIEEADQNLIVVIKEMREAARTADEHGDPGTVDVFSRLVQIHEKHEWWARDILRKGDGLTT